MNNIRSFSGKPDDFTVPEREAFAQLVINGGAISPENHDRLPQRIQSCSKLAVFYDETPDPRVLAAFGALKEPSIEYRRSVFHKTLSNINHYDYAYELGYLMVAESHRNNHLCDQIVDSLLGLITERNGIYATTSSEIVANKLIRRGFQKVGSPYPSWKHTEERPCLLSLYVRPSK